MTTAPLSSSSKRALDALAGKQGRTAYFAGAGGCGMRGLAGFLLASGWEVWGADRKPMGKQDLLVQSGLIPLLEGEAAPDVSLAIRSAAVPFDDAGYQSAHNRGARALKYADLLGEVSRLRPMLAVAGSHGKTTVTSWVAWGLREAGVEAGFLVGAEVPQLATSADWGDPTLPWVAETCEYDRSFHATRPANVALLNVDAEHPDTYPGGLPEVLEAFEVFLSTLPKTGVVYAGPEAPNLSYATEASWVLLDPIPDSWTVGLPGKHNRLNAAVVAGVLASFSLTEEQIRHALAHFHGASRRMETVGELNGACLVSDYAHHPVEVASTLQAAQEQWPGKRLVVVFQPHQAQRMHAYREQFAPSLDAADALVLLPVFRARDPENMKANVEELVPALYSRRSDRTMALCGDFEEAQRALLSWLGPDDVLLALGAGSVDTFVRNLASSAS